MTSSMSTRREMGGDRLGGYDLFGVERQRKEMPLTGTAGNTDAAGGPPAPSEEKCSLRNALFCVTLPHI